MLHTVCIASLEFCIYPLMLAAQVYVSNSISDTMLLVSFSDLKNLEYGYPCDLESCHSVRHLCG
jgi:hypothetical protein